MHPEKLLALKAAIRADMQSILAGDPIAGVTLTQRQIATINRRAKLKSLWEAGVLPEEIAKQAGYKNAASVESVAWVMGLTGSSKGSK